MFGLLGSILGRIAAGAVQAITIGRAAVSGITLSGLSTGAAIVGTGLSIVGAATGNSTLTKIGAGIGLAGGAGMLAGGMREIKSASGITGTASKTKGLLQTDNIDDILSASSKGLYQTPARTRGASPLNNFTQPNLSNPAVTKSMDAFNLASGKIGTTAGGFDPELEKSYFQRAGDTLTKYDSTLGALGGMGNAYMMNERFDLEKDLLDKRLAFEQQDFNRTSRNMDTPVGLTYTPNNYQRNLNAYTPLLQRHT